MILIFIVYLAFNIGQSTAVLPLVLWHGVGDTCCAEHTLKYLNIFREMTNNTFVLSVMMGSNEHEDYINTYIMPLDLQVETGCRILSRYPELRNGYNGFGWSQGTMPMRGLAERCESPPMRTLLQLGGPNMGQFGIPNCERVFSAERCDLIRRVVSEFVYANQVQAEFWHDPLQEARYRASSRYLAHLNNERDPDPRQKRNFESLRRLVLVKFLQDTTIIPRESEWFGFYKENSTSELYAMRDGPLYTQDLIGLRALDERNVIAFEAFDGEHTVISDDYFRYLVRTYLMDD